MDNNENYKLVYEDVMKDAELKRALILYKILRDSPLINEADKMKISQQLDQIRHHLKIEESGFKALLFQLENGRGFTQVRVNIDDIKTEANKKEIVSNQIFEDDQHFELGEGQRRFCMNKNCKFSFIPNKSIKKLIRKCLRCSGPTLFIVDNNNEDV